MSDEHIIKTFAEMTNDPNKNIMINAVDLFMKIENIVDAIKAKVVKTDESTISEILAYGEGQVATAIYKVTQAMIAETVIINNMEEHGNT